MRFSERRQPCTFTEATEIFLLHRCRAWLENTELHWSCDESHRHHLTLIININRLVLDDQSG